jgi:hypothetical protein
MEPDIFLPSGVGMDVDGSVVGRGPGEKMGLLLEGLLGLSSGAGDDQPVGMQRAEGQGA